jgi:hypothetical protein
MEIRVNPFDLSKDEREAIAGFILTYPGEGKMETVSGVIRVPDSPEVREALATLKPEAGKLEILEDPAAAFKPLPTPPATSEVINVPNPPATSEVINVPNPPALSTTGPMLVIPQPEPAAGNAQAGGSLVTLDKVGFPWDERIHASTKTFNADGTWRKKRGVDATTISTVEAELKLLMAIPSPAPAQVAVIPPPPGSPTAPPAAPDQADLRSQFVALVGRASAALTAGKLTQAEMASACASVGVDSLPKLGIRLDLVPRAAVEIDRLIASHQ